MAYTSTNFVINDEAYFAGYTEVLEQQALDMSGMNGGFVFENRDVEGNLVKKSFFESIGASIISDRDPTDMTAASWNDLTMGETVGVRAYKSAKERKAISAFRELGEDPQVMSFALGAQHSKATALSFLNSGLSAAVGAFNAISGVQFDGTAVGTGVLTPDSLVRMLDKMGDSSGKVIGFITHSKMAHDLLGDQVASSVSTVAGPSIYNGTFGSLGLPVFRTDSPALVDLDPAGDGTLPAEYKVIAVTEGAIRITEAQERDILTRTDDTAANLAINMTLEYSFVTEIKGCEWIGSNYPTDAELADSANWSYSFSDVRSGPGVIGTFNSRESV